MSKYSTLLLEDRNGLRIIKFNNPKRKNAIANITYQELILAFDEAANDDTVKIVAISGVGDFYSSGNDIKSALEAADDMEKKIQESKPRIFKFVKSFYSFPKPLVGVINGPCIGIAATTAALCDVLYASEKAYFTTPFVSLGLCPEGGSSYTFPKILGKSKAMEMLMFNHKMSAEEALKFNFISEIFKLSEIDKIWDRLEDYAQNPMNSMKICKKLVKLNEIECLENANFEENEELALRWYSDEVMDAMMKFMSRKSKL